MVELTNKGLVQHAKQMLMLPTSYMWGTLARKIDSGTIDWCKKTYPSMYSADRVAYLKKQIGKRYGCDCVGLIKSYYFGGVGSPKYTANRDYNTKVLPSIRKHGLYAVDQLMILSILVDTFSARISMSKQQYQENHNISAA